MLNRLDAKRVVLGYAKVLAQALAKADARVVVLAGAEVHVVGYAPILAFQTATIIVQILATRFALLVVPQTVKELVAAVVLVFVKEHAKGIQHTIQ